MFFWKRGCGSEDTPIPGPFPLKKGARVSMVWIGFLVILLSVPFIHTKNFPRIEPLKLAMYTLFERIKYIDYFNNEVIKIISSRKAVKAEVEQYFQFSKG
jgi:hypothetical protein